MRRAGEVHNDVDEVLEERWFSCEGAGLKRFTTSLKNWHDRALASHVCHFSTWDLQFHVPKCSKGIPRITQANELLKEIEQSPLQAIQGDSAMKGSWNGKLLEKNAYHSILVEQSEREQCSLFAGYSNFLIYSSWKAGNSLHVQAFFCHFTTSP